MSKLFRCVSDTKEVLHFAVDEQATAIVEAVRETVEWRHWAFMARRAQLDALAEFCETIAAAIEAGG